MLTIRDAQRAAFEAVHEEKEIDILVEDLGERYEDFGARPPEEKRAIVKDACRRAAAYGLHDEMSLQGFLELVCSIAPNFDDHPPFKELLSKKSLPPHMRPLAIMAIADDETVKSLQQAKPGS